MRKMKKLSLILILTSGIIASSVYARSIDEMSTDEICALLDQQLEYMKISAVEKKSTKKEEPSFEERSPVLRSRMLATTSRLCDKWAGRNNYRGDEHTMHCLALRHKALHTQMHGYQNKKRVN